MAASRGIINCSLLKAISPQSRSVNQMERSVQMKMMRRLWPLVPLADAAGEGAESGIEGR